MNSQPGNIWLNSEEEYLRKLQKQMIHFANVYEVAYRAFYRQEKIVKIPLIFISAINGLASFGTTSFPPQSQAYIPLCVGILSMIVGIVTGIETYLGISSNRSQSKDAAANFRSLSRTIDVELSLPVQDRSQNGSSFVRTMFSKAEAIYAYSPPINKKQLVFEPEKIILPLSEQNQFLNYRNRSPQRYEPDSKDLENIFIDSTPTSSNIII
jgi:hypothetical protein